MNPFASACLCLHGTPPHKQPGQTAIENVSVEALRALVFRRFSTNLLPGRLAESTDILSPSRPLSKSTVSAPFVPPLERQGQRSGELIACFTQPRDSDLRVIARHQLLGVGMEVDLLVYPTLHWTQAPSRERDAGSADPRRT